MMTTTKALPPLPPCPSCGQRLHDNRADRAGPRSPVARCSNTQCVDEGGRRSAFWEKDLLSTAPQPAARANGAHQPAPAPKAEPATDTATQFQLASRAHYKALKFVLDHEAKLIQSLGGDVAGAVAAMAATIYIELHRTNGGNHR